VTDGRPNRVALVVHPTRPIDGAFATLRRWAEAHDIAIMQLKSAGVEREMATPGELAPADLVVALGGDGTVLAALRAAAVADVPVVGVACGSLGALTAVSADELAGALDRLLAGDVERRAVPALRITTPGGETVDLAINDVVAVRRGAGQLLSALTVDGELYARTAGDGVIVATPLGSSAYTMAAGGPILAGGTRAMVCTPLAMHGGSAPPLVVPADSTIDLGQPRPPSGERYTLRLHDDRVTLLTFGPPGRGFEGLRRRGLVTDSPRILARDRREHERGPDSGASTSDLAAADRQDDDAL
jgi:NAD+ kinase